MLKIRSEQMKALRSVPDREFLLRLRAHVAQRWPELPEGAAGEAWLVALVERAREYRLSKELDIARFVDLTCEFGRDFELDPRHADAAAILTSRQAASIRMRQLDTWVESARAARDPSPREQR
ncbi:hypothetical protein [Pyxidicoccus sp. MSG2]|uniref:hypothetical protein n=1 Tax=Pyxidicoccus sp. MSG2 TaxID=2996790 RepID=UPI00226E1481|nr:hypothetical protein [Pyxidicoccus sp. MSG2]MCY1023913.1 hypothetical protein [Pyxidicoccus sp. MSG2]